MPMWSSFFRDVFRDMCLVRQISQKIWILNRKDWILKRKTKRKDMKAMFSLNFAQDSRLHFRLKNIDFIVSFEEVSKKRNFFIFDPLYLTTETENRVYGFVNCTSICNKIISNKIFYWLHFYLEKDVKLFIHT